MAFTSVAPQPQVRVPPREQLEKAATALASARKIAIVAGAGARGAGVELEQVAEKLGAPIPKAALAKNCVPDDSPYCTGGLGFAGTRPSHEAFENCDGLLIVGSLNRDECCGSLRVAPCSRFTECLEWGLKKAFVAEWFTFTAGCISSESKEQPG